MAPMRTTPSRHSSRSWGRPSPRPLTARPSLSRRTAQPSTPDPKEVPSMSSPTLSQKLTAEAIGTAILVFIGAGSVPLTVFLTNSSDKLAFGSAELSTISFAFAFAIFAAVYSVGHISGCHINPAVTVALLATRKIDAGTAAAYIVAQVVGAFIGAGLTLIILTGHDVVALGLGA